MQIYIYYYILKGCQKDPHHPLMQEKDTNYEKEINVQVKYSG